MKKHFGLLLMAFLLSSGLLAQDALDVEVVKAGDGEKPAMGQEVETHVLATDAEGNVIWSTRDMGFTNYFVLGKEKDPFAVAMDKAVLDMQQGGMYKVTVPRTLFGDNAPPNMKGDYAVVEVELINVAEPQPNGPDKVLELYDEKGIDIAMGAFRELQVDEGAFTMREWDVNRLGYILMEKKELDAAIEVFQFNTEQHPRSANAYDSLGDGYAAKGDTDNAIASYQKALEINPDFQASRDKLDKLK